MMTVMSADRLLLILFPLWHISQGAKYALVICAIGWAYAFGIGIVGYVMLVPLKPYYPLTSLFSVIS